MVRLVQIGCVISFLAITSCGVFNSEGAQPKNYSIGTAPDIHLHFTGRGAASGAMLMSAMGPAGIAVGLAIDVGIGKDIERYGFPDGLNAEAIFTSALASSETSTKPAHLFFAPRKKPHFEFKKLGFVEAVGQDNLISPAIEVTVQKANWLKTYRYPDDFVIEAKAKPLQASLEQLKSPTSPARALLQQALIAVIQKSIQDWKIRDAKI